MDGGRPGLEALELSHSQLVGFVVDEQFLWLLKRYGGCLPVDKTDEKAFGVFNCDDRSAAWCGIHVLDMFADDCCA